MATESGGDETGDHGGPGGPGDETGDKTAATAGENKTRGVIYADEGPYTINVRYLCLVSIVKFVMATLRKTLKR